MPSPDSPKENQPPAAPEQFSQFAGLNPEELLARGMQSVRMTGGGGLTNWEPPNTEEAARLFPNYEVVDLCGRGGMGAVYKAKQTALDRLVAIKLLPLEVSVDRDFADRFVREARTMAKLNHPNIVSVFDFGKTSQGHLFFVMEYVEGATLHQMIKTVGLQPAQALEIIARVCEALNYAHGEGVVHRDIKPANILVDIKGRVKVTDFGLARLNSPTAEQWGQTMTGMVLGTPDYMAPEQKNGARVDHRADIYSLGVMLYEMLCGQVPQGIFDPPSHRISVDDRVDQVVIRAMQQEPDRRYHNTGEMKTDVETIRTAIEQNPAFAAVRPAVPRPPGAPSIPGAPPPAPVRPGVPAPPAPYAPSAPGLATTQSVPSVPGAPVAPAAPALAPVPVKSKTPLVVALTAAACAVIGAGIWLLKPPAPGSIPTPAEIAKAPSAIAPEKTTPPNPVKPREEIPQPTPAPVAVAAVAPAPVATVTELQPPAPAADPPPTVPHPPPAAFTPPSDPLASIPIEHPPAPMPAEAVREPIAPPSVTEWQVLAEQGEKLLKQHQRIEAVAAFDRAFNAAENSAPTLELGRLCQRLASLQAVFSSSAEARGTLQRGLQAMKKGKPGPDLTKMIDEMEAQLHALPHD